MTKIVLYHGSPNKTFTPIYGYGEDRHDYGKGFYLTDNVELAKEWSVSRPNESNAWVHKYELNLTDLKVLDFTEHSVLSWLAELMKHREADDSKRYKVLSKEFINKYGIDTEPYDVIKGWRANASYFYIAKEFVRDLGIQYCLKSQKAFDNLKELEKDLIAVDFKEFNEKYNKRDINARKNMRDLIDSDKNEVKNVFSRLLER